jgi:tetrahydromethanopterin S-methyltransferase subunit G
MATLEERVAYLEGKVEEHSRGWGPLAARIDALEEKVDRFRNELSARIGALDRKVDRFREELSARIDALDQRMARQFVWLVGIQVTVLLAVVGALLAR